MDIKASPTVVDPQFTESSFSRPRSLYYVQA